MQQPTDSLNSLDEDVGPMDWDAEFDELIELSECEVNDSPQSHLSNEHSASEINSADRPDSAVELSTTEATAEGVDEAKTAIVAHEDSCPDSEVRFANPNNNMESGDGPSKMKKRLEKLKGKAEAEKIEQERLNAKHERAHDKMVETHRAQHPGWATSESPSLIRGSSTSPEVCRWATSEPLKQDRMTTIDLAIRSHEDVGPGMLLKASCFINVTNDLYWIPESDNYRYPDGALGEKIYKLRGNPGAKGLKFVSEAGVPDDIYTPNGSRFKRTIDRFPPDGQAFYPAPSRLRIVETIDCPENDDGSEMLEKVEIDSDIPQSLESELRNSNERLDDSLFSNSMIEPKEDSLVFSSIEQSEIVEGLSLDFETVKITVADDSDSDLEECEDIDLNDGGMALIRTNIETCDNTESHDPFDIYLDMAEEDPDVRHALMDFSFDDIEDSDTESDIFLDSLDSSYSSSFDSDHLDTTGKDNADVDDSESHPNAENNLSSPIGSKYFHSPSKMMPGLSDCLSHRYIADKSLECDVHHKSESSTESSSSDHSGSLSGDESDLPSVRSSVNSTKTLAVDNKEAEYELSDDFKKVRQDCRTPLEKFINGEDSFTSITPLSASSDGNIITLRSLPALPNGWKWSAQSYFARGSPGSPLFVIQGDTDIADPANSPCGKSSVNMDDELAKLEELSFVSLGELSCFKSGGPVDAPGVHAEEAVPQKPDSEGPTDTSEVCPEESVLQDPKKLTKATDDTVTTDLAHGSADTLKMSVKEAVPQQSKDLAEATDYVITSERADAIKSEAIEPTEDSHIAEAIDRADSGSSPATAIFNEVITDHIEAITEPIGATTGPIEAITESKKVTDIAETTEATMKPIQAIAGPIEAIAKPIEAITEPTQITTEAIDDTTEPIEATTKPIEATTKPTKATDIAEATDIVGTNSIGIDSIEATEPSKVIDAADIIDAIDIGLNTTDLNNTDIPDSISVTNAIEFHAEEAVSQAPEELTKATDYTDNSGLSDNATHTDNTEPTENLKAIEDTVATEDIKTTEDTDPTKTTALSNRTYTSADLNSTPVFVHVLTWQSGTLRKHPIHNMIGWTHVLDLVHSNLEKKLKKQPAWKSLKTGPLTEMCKELVAQQKLRQPRVSVPSPPEEIETHRVGGFVGGLFNSAVKSVSGFLEMSKAYLYDDV